MKLLNFVTVVYCLTKHNYLPSLFQIVVISKFGQYTTCFDSLIDGMVIIK